jgi:hypothetical protein
MDRVEDDLAGGATATATDATAPEAGVAEAPLQMAPVSVESFVRSVTFDDSVASCPAVAVMNGMTCWVCLASVAENTNVPVDTPDVGVAKNTRNVPDASE